MRITKKGEKMTKEEIMNLKDETTIVIERGSSSNEDKIVLFLKSNIKEEIDKDGSKKTFYIYNGIKYKLDDLRVAEFGDYEFCKFKRYDQLNNELVNLYNNLEMTNEQFLIKKEELSRELDRWIIYFYNLIDNNNYKFKKIYKYKDKNWEIEKKNLEEKIKILYYFINFLQNDGFERKALEEKL